MNEFCLRPFHVRVLLATALLGVAAAAFANPVINQDFPDPSVLNVSGTYYAYATNTGGKNMPCARSTDLNTWTQLADAMPALPSWASGGLTWAPVVHQFGSTFVAYVSVQNPSTGHHSIVVATSGSPSGPITALSSPIDNQSTMGGD